MVTVLSEEKWTETSFVIQPRELDTIQEMSSLDDSENESSFSESLNESMKLKSSVIILEVSKCQLEKSFEILESVYMVQLNCNTYPRFRSSVHVNRTSSLRMIQIFKDPALNKPEKNDVASNVGSLTTSEAEFLKNEILIRQELDHRPDKSLKDLTISSIRSSIDNGNTQTQGAKLEFTEQTKPQPRPRTSTLGRTFPKILDHQQSANQLENDSLTAPKTCLIGHLQPSLNVTNRSKDSHYSIDSAQSNHDSSSWKKSPASSSLFCTNTTTDTSSGEKLSELESNVSSTSSVASTGNKIQPLTAASGTAPTLFFDEPDYRFRACINELCKVDYRTISLRSAESIPKVKKIIMKKYFIDESEHISWTLIVATIGQEESKWEELSGNRIVNWKQKYSSDNIDLIRLIIRRKQYLI